MDMNKTKIGKLTSENPRVMKMISMKEALNGYFEYIGYCLKAHAREVKYASTREGVKTPQPLKLKSLKTFNKWRTTEI